MPTSFDTQMISYVAAIAATLLFLLLFWVRGKRAANLALKQQRERLRRQEKELTTVNKQLLEVRSVVIGLGQKVTEQQDLIAHLGERIRELENTDSDGRLYSRASKMVRLGADVNELIQECELPKAEAELMMALQNKIANRQQGQGETARAAAPKQQTQRQAPPRRPASSSYPPKRPIKR